MINDAANQSISQAAPPLAAAAGIRPRCARTGTGRRSRGSCTKLRVLPGIPGNSGRIRTKRTMGYAQNGENADEVVRLDGRQTGGMFSKLDLAGSQQNRTTERAAQQRRARWQRASKPREH
ncbi:hypothetical protein Aduo_008646 [Ancylostoma duodenale]